MVKVLAIIALLFLVGSCFATAPIDKIDNLVSVLGAVSGRQLGGCPLCDSSVYSYCSYKMLHDACCCGGQYGPIMAPSCQYTDCQILYAKTCYEHQLIRRCCCENPYEK